MKKAIYLIVFAIALFSSCNEDKFLDETEMALKQSPTFLNDADLEKVIVSGYFLMKSGDGVFGLSDAPIMYEGVGDLFAYKKFTTVVDTRNNYSIASRDYTNVRIELLKYMWLSGYTIIQHANVVLDFYSKNQPFGDADQATMDRMLGESYFLRAFSYHSLARIFALPYQSDVNAPNVVFRTTPMYDPLDYGKRGTSTDIYNQIISDLENAIRLLPEDVSNTTANTSLSWRAKKEAAMFLLARTYFLMGESFWGDATDSYQAGKKTSLGLINDLIALGKYTLVTGADIKTVFSQGGTTFKKTTEVVFQEIDTETWRGNRVGWYYSPQFVTNNNRYFRSYALDSTMIWNMGWNNETEARKDARYKAYFIRYDNDPTTMFAQPDPEYGAEYRADELNIWCNKYRQAKHLPHFRISEMYLTRAAIYLKKGFTMSQIRSDLNLLRTRAGISVIPDTYTVTIDDLKIDWAKEMAGEGTYIVLEQALKMDIGPAGRKNVTSVPYDHRSLYFYFPLEEVDRNPEVEN